MNKGIHHIGDDNAKIVYDCGVSLVAVMSDIRNDNSKVRIFLIQ